MRVFLTGAAGFIGREIASELRLRGHVVTSLVRREDQLWSGCDIAGDMFDPRSYLDTLQKFRPDALVHAAWRGVPARERDDPSQFDNVGALTTLATHAAQAGARVFVGLGTQAEYGLTTAMVDESAPTCPVTTYGEAKLAAGAALLHVARQHGARGVWGRVFGVYGPQETAPSMLPWLARELVAGRTPQLTACSQHWDFLYVSDVARAVVELLECESANGVFNIASGAAPSLRDTVLMLRDLIDAGIEPMFGAVPFGPKQVMFLGGNPGKLMRVTGWRPEVSLERGLRTVAEEAFDLARLA